MQTLRQIAGLIDGLNDKLGVVIRWLALLMVLTGAVSAVVRYFARSQQWTLNLTPATEAQWYFFSVIFLLGAAYGLNHDVHVRVDVMYERMSAKVRALIDMVGTILFLIPFSILMLYVSFPAVRVSWEIKEMSPDPGGLPRYPIKALILVSFTLLLLQAFSQLVKQADVLLGNVSERVQHEVNPEAHR
ncbi:MAG: TRAP transporter small permease subunit [Gemmatimonadota bacterium]|nr:TRAP transporter small permease subunit [Gemmatimonadota bacterium]MDE3005576.1 TRAP transporter small permease subunit [Gemmatimonadota bacterium]MDE3013330.1 TRAP transporter small permease subunit [Gemmatimonadota bacterium]